MSSALYLRTLRRELSIAKTSNCHSTLAATITQTKDTVSPTDTAHSDVEVASQVLFFLSTRYTDREDTKLLLHFLGKGSITDKQCTELARILVDKHKFDLPNPLDPDLRTELETAERASFEAEEALLAAQHKTRSTREGVKAVVARIKAGKPGA
jgi:hypothetical protein